MSIAAENTFIITTSHIVLCIIMSSSEGIYSLELYHLFKYFYLCNPFGIAKFIQTQFHFFFIICFYQHIHTQIFFCQHDVFKKLFSFSVCESYLVFKVFLLMFIIIILFFSYRTLILILLNIRCFEMLRFNVVTDDVMYLFYLLTFMGKFPLKY